MSDGFATTYAKAVDDLAGKIFLPGLIASLLVEFGPAYQQEHDANMLSTYIVFVVMGFMITGLILSLIAAASIYLFKGEHIAPIIAVAIMPIGFAGLFPEHFSNFHVPISQVTGVAILAWCFMLLRNSELHVGA